MKFLHHQHQSQTYVSKDAERGFIFTFPCYFQMELFINLQSQGFRCSLVDNEADCFHTVKAKDCSPWRPPSLPSKPHNAFIGALKNTILLLRYTIEAVHEIPQAQ